MVGINLAIKTKICLSISCIFYLINFFFYTQEHASAFISTDLIKVIAFFFDFFNTFISTIVLAAKGEDDEDCKISSVVIFANLFTGLLFTTIGLSICCTCIEFLTPVELIIALIEILGVLLYFVGDNLPIAMSIYAYGTDDAERSVFAGKVLLGTSIFFLSLLPRVLENIILERWNDEDDEKKSIGLLLSLLALLVEFDALFTAITRISGEECSTSGKIADFILLGVLCMFYVLLFFPIAIKLSVYAENDFVYLYVVALALVGMGSLCFHLLADNEKPLKCAQDCPTIGNPFNETSCETIYYGLRAGFAGGAILSTLLSAAISCCLINTVFH